MVMIGGREVSRGTVPYTVAEVGINHNGELEKVFEMINVAKNSGVDAVKFQTFKAEEFVADPSQTYTYFSQGQEVTESMLEMFKRYEFSKDEWKIIKEKCVSEGIQFLSTPQNYSDLLLLQDIGIDAIKVGSDDFNNIKLLREYASFDIPLVLSCGMSDLGEIFSSLEVVEAQKKNNVILLLCTSQYPTPPADVNLNKINTLRAAFPYVEIGFSDHTQGPLASSLASAMGACFFEKHFTLSNDLPGPDHWFSENPTGLKSWVDNIHKARLMMGSSVVKPTADEAVNRKEFRRYLIASKDINEGDEYSSDNVELKRVGGGGILPASFYEYIIGGKASRNFTKGEMLSL